MKVLVSFPGRHGDILWALPTMRAISEYYQTPVDLLIAGEFAGLVSLLRLQPYLGAVNADPTWGYVGPEHRIPYLGDREVDYSRIYHLGYRDWPKVPLPFDIWETAVAQGLSLEPIDLTRPWITVPGAWHPPAPLIVGFTDAWFELKLGLLALVRHALPSLECLQLTAPGSRWATEAPFGLVSVRPCAWEEAARTIRDAGVFFGDCAALHVLAVALGTSVFMVEPMEARWNPIFFPLGMAGRVKVIMGNDNRPTFDSRHTADALREVLG